MSWQFSPDSLSLSIHIYLVLLYLSISICRLEACILYNTWLARSVWCGCDIYLIYISHQRIKSRRSSRENFITHTSSKTQKIPYTHTFFVIITPRTRNSLSRLYLGKSICVLLSLSSLRRILFLFLSARAVSRVIRCSHGGCATRESALYSRLAAAFLLFPRLGCISSSSSGGGSGPLREHVSVCTRIGWRRGGVF